LHRLSLLWLYLLDRTPARPGLLLRRPPGRLLLLRIRLRFEYRAAIIGELRRILPQTRHDPADVRNLITAQSPYIGGAGHLLFPGSAIFLR
jgi:hypothetical protein